jgi:uncharacterized sulfatase
MQGRVFLGEQSEPPREYLFGGRDRGDETVFHIRTVRDKRYRYLRNKYPERPFLQINRYKERQYPIIGLMRHLDGQGKLEGLPAVLMAPTRPKEELYDLENDPWETKNLADAPEYQDVKRRLAAKMDEWIEEIHDTGRTPEDPEIVKKWERQAKRNDEYLNSRPVDWYLTAPALGPYKPQESNGTGR